MPPAFEVLLLNTAIPQIQAAQSGDTYLVPRDIAINATAIISANSATDALRITQTGAGNAILVEDSANPDSTPFVVTATGDVGIGTSSPAMKLDVRVSNSASLQGAFNLSNSVNSDFSIQLSSSVAQIGTGTSTPIVFATGNAEKMRLDSSGNLGLGVTPSAWSNYKAVQVGYTGALSNHVNLNYLRLESNSFNGASGETYIQDGYATKYAQNNGAGIHAWYTAPSGTANSASVADTKSYTVVALGTTTLLQWQALFSGLGSLPSLGQVITATATGSIPNGGLVTQNISFTQAMTLSGTAAPALRVGVTADVSGFNFQAANQAGFSVHNSGSSATAAYFSAANNVTLTSAGNFAVINGVDGILFGASAAERARITSGGYFKASDNNGTYNNLAGTYHELYQSTVETAVLVSAVNASFANNILQLNAARNTTNNSFYALSYYNSGAGAYKLRVADSGDVTNTNGTYGTISDAKMKTDIVDAGSQWSDIKALRFRKFKMKDDPSGLVQLGVVAQEVEQTSPGLVDEHADKDAEGNDLGTTTKSVKTSVLLMKAAVALQEAMARIEKLEAEVAALKGA